MAPSILPGCLAGLPRPRLPTLTPSLATPLASVTDFIVDPIVEAATDFIDSVGLIGVFLLMVLESACIPVPSEAIMLFAGFNVSEGDLTMFGIIAAGVLGNVVGSWIAWAAGYYGRMELLEKNRLVHINPEAPRLGRRLVPAPRRRDRLLHPHAPDHPHLHLTARRHREDAVLALHLAHAPGCIPWVTMLAFIGREVGDNWEEWRDYLHYFDYPVAAAILAGIVYFLIKRRGGGPPPAPADTAA